MCGRGIVRVIQNSQNLSGIFSFLFIGRGCASVVGSSPKSDGVMPGFRRAGHYFKFIIYYQAQCDVKCDVIVDHNL